MRSLRSLSLGAGMAVAASSLLLGTSAGYASPQLTRPSEPRSVVPPPDAPHVGHVVGAHYGPNIAVRTSGAVHAFRVLHRQLVDRSRTGSPERINTIHPSKGTSFDAFTVGSQATQSVSTKIRASQPSTYLYTPTMFPSGGSTPGSCVEVTTAYMYGTQAVSAWDWCVAINFVAQVDINKRFMRIYTRHHNYSTQIVQTDAATNKWTAYLYNYKLGTWEKFFAQRGTSELPGVQGWDVYELYSELDGSGQSYACADLEGKRIEARRIFVGVDGQLVKADPSNAGQIYDHPDSDFHCDSFSYQMINPLSHWKAIG